jgi:signal transduction histidine kinase
VEAVRNSHSEHRDGIEALGQLAVGFAHDLGNVMAATKLNLDTIERSKLDPGTKVKVDSAIAAVVDGLSVIDSLLFLCRRGTRHRERIDVRRALSRAELLIRHSLDAEVRVAVSVAPDIWPIIGDESQLEVAILNLAVNARDAMPRGGSLRIEAFNVQVAIPDGRSGDFVVVSAIDTGSGMLRDVSAKAFEPFFTTKGPKKGTGLGLSQVCQFVQDCGGSVAIDSAPQRGTSVTMYLPRAKKRIVALSKAASDPSFDRFPLARLPVRSDASD